MKKYRVWAYDKISYYVDLNATNKSDAYTRAMDVNVLDWRQGDDSDYPDLNIKKRDIEEIKNLREENLKVRLTTVCQSYFKEQISEEISKLKVICGKTASFAID